MNPGEVPPGSEIFIDANIFVYHFSGPTELTPACSAFLRRIEDHALQGFTSLTVVSEVLHRLMSIEATETLAVEPRQTVRYLKEHPAEVKKLTRHVLVPGKIQALGVRILVPTLEDLLASEEGDHVIYRNRIPAYHPRRGSDSGHCRHHDESGGRRQAKSIQRWRMTGSIGKHSSTTSSVTYTTEAVGIRP